MIGNPALDVVIGLVFVYLLYSLYATILMEIISSSFGLRARNLCYAIARMLKDEKKYESRAKESASRVLTSFKQVLGKSSNLEHNALHDKFFEQPSIKYLSSGGLSNKPSYLSAESFAKGLIDSIKIDDPDISLLGRIEQGLNKTPEEGGLLPEDSETKKHILSLLEDANNDLVKFRILLEQWYNHTMDRATGWFKRSTQSILIIIGFILAISFNVDTLAIIKKLSKDEDARNQLVKMASDFTTKNSALVESIRSDTSKLHDRDSQSVMLLNKRLDSLQSIRTMLTEDIENSQNILSSDWYITNTLSYQKDSTFLLPSNFVKFKYVMSKTDSGYVMVHKAVDLDILKSILPHKHEGGVLKINTLWYKLRYAFSFHHILGYLLTVLALSLGAPFWFDLLNKLVKLRTSVAASAESTNNSSTTGSSSSNREILNRVG